MQCLAFETPLLYAPAVRGTYSEGEERKQIFITAAREKRSVTENQQLADQALAEALARGQRILPARKGVSGQRLG